MYTLIRKKGKQGIQAYDYVFKDFKAYDEVTASLTYKLSGRYAIRVDSEKADEVLAFVQDVGRHERFDVDIYMSANTLEYLAQRNTHLNIRGEVSPVEAFKQLVSEKRILFAKDVMYTLYNSIAHDMETMESALDHVAGEFGQEAVVTEKMLSGLFLLNKVVYPRTVLLAFLRMERYRWKKAEASVAEIGNAVVAGAMAKNTKKLVKEKATYYMTGQGSALIKGIDTKNLMLMYRVLVAERVGLEDVALLMKLYERGISPYDILQQRES